MNLAAIVVPRGRLPQNIPNETKPPGLRRMASTSTPPKRDIFEIGPRSKSRNSFDFNRDPQSRHGAAYTGRSGFVWPFHNNKSGNLETTTSKVSLHEKPGSSSNASKFRVVGRGGSGSKLRQVSVSNPVVVLETESTPSIRQQPLDQAAAAAAAPFFRPSGRGGLGSLSTSPPTARKQLKPPTTILGMLRGRKRSEVQINEQYKSSTPRRSQSVIYLSKQAQRDIADYSDDFSIRTSSFDEGPSASTSKNTYPYHYYDDRDDRDSYIEEVSRRKSNEHRERSLNKLTRTLGAHPMMSMMTDSDRQQLAFKSPILDICSTTTTMEDNNNNKQQQQQLMMILEPSWKTRRRPDSFESDTLTSPITFASPPSEPTTGSTPPLHTAEHHDWHWQTLSASDVDSNFSNTRRRKASIAREDDLSSSSAAASAAAAAAAAAVAAHSHSRGGSSSSSSSQVMPRLHVSTHSTSDAVSVSSSSDVLPPPDPNGPVAKSDWLVPLNEVVISIRRTAPSKPQSWTGEWNREMKDVIRDLRRL